MKTKGPNRDVLILGGGIAGMQTALLLAEKQHQVHVLERAPSVGGFFPLLDRTFPTNSCGVCFMSPTPPALCPIYENDLHENISLLTNCRLESFGGQAGDFEATYLQRPRYVDGDKCTLCGKCSEVCPIEVPRKLGGGAERVKAIDLPWAQAVPRTYSIDEEACTRCGDCLDACEPGAISLDEKPVAGTIRAGAVVLGFGFEPFEAELRGEYGFGRYQNVVSSIQYERMLSLSGPNGGKPVRPSDGKPAGRLAFIQCVGSRDKSCGREYCSTICCMYATKQAMISKDRDRSMDVAVYYMDIRPIGKDYERYYQRAENEYGVRYQRSAVSTVRELHQSRNLKFTYLSDGGELHEEEFDLVVLSVGFSPPADSRRVADLIGAELDQYGFCQTDELSPGATSVPGVFVAGAFSGPKDIPEAVVEASGIASDISVLLNGSPAAEPASHDTHAEISQQANDEDVLRIGLFFCDSRGRLSNGIDLAEIERGLRDDPELVSTHLIDVTSPKNGSAQICDAVREDELNRVVLAGYQSEAVSRMLDGQVVTARAGIGEQCVDVHPDNPTEALVKSRTLVCAAIKQVKEISIGAPTTKVVERSVLVVGGGLAGMSASLSLADQGLQVILVEREGELGGNAISTYYTLDGSDLQAAVTDTISKVERHPGIEVCTDSYLTAFDGTWGSFRSEITTGDEVRAVSHGALIVATGGHEALPDQYLFGTDERVVTQRTLERLIARGAQVPMAQSVVMIQCVGSRDENHPYCSRICCGQAVKNAIRLKDRNPDGAVYVLYRDVRTYGFYEKYYREARERGVIFVRFEPESKPTVTAGNKSLEVSYHDPVVGEKRTIGTDLVVLSTGVVPSHGDPHLAEIAGLDLNSDGFFLEANAKAAPLDSVKRGVYFCGLCHSPNYAREVISQAKAAAARASALLWYGEKTLPENQAYVSERRCSGCGLCVTACPYDAREIDEVSDKARVLSDLCKGCGTCVVVCPNGASQQHGFEASAMLGVVNTVVGV